MEPTIKQKIIDTFYYLIDNKPKISCVKNNRGEETYLLSKNITYQKLKTKIDIQIKKNKTYLLEKPPDKSEWEYQIEFEGPGETFVENISEREFEEMKYAYLIASTKYPFSLDKYYKKIQSEKNH